MKVFNYFGQSIITPDYAKFVATDQDGEIWWYTHKPNDAYDMWIVAKGGNCGRVGKAKNVKNWRKSLNECLFTRTE